VRANKEIRENILREKKELKIAENRNLSGLAPASTSATDFGSRNNHLITQNDVK
jgi:hypothetical protein